MPRSSTGSIDKLKSRHWCFTLNNPEGEAELYDSHEWNTCPIHYMIVGLEYGDEKSTPHHQGYVHWVNPRTGAAMRKLLPRAHWEKCVGSEADNYAYCAKDNNLVGEWGERGTTHDDEEAEAHAPARQGKRTDLDAARALVDSGANWRTIVASVTSFNAMRVAAEYLSVAELGRSWKTAVTWIYGPTGTGKTTLAHDLCETDPWISSRTLKWFDGYDAHEDVIFDEFRGDYCTFHELLRFCDALPLRVEIKRGSRQFLARRIFITSCYPPHLVYSRNSEELLQLGRRLNRIVWIPAQNMMLWKPGTAIGPEDPSIPYLVPFGAPEQGVGGNTVGTPRPSASPPSSPHPLTPTSE